MGKTQCTACGSVLDVNEVFTYEENGTNYGICTECGQWFPLNPQKEGELDGHLSDQA
jgi:uncharacterized Zn finger protein